MRKLKLEPHYFPSHTVLFVKVLFGGALWDFINVIRLIWISLNTYYCITLSYTIILLYLNCLKDKKEIILWKGSIPYFGHWVTLLSIGVKGRSG